MERVYGPLVLVAALVLAAGCRNDAGSTTTFEAGMDFKPSSEPVRSE